MIFGIPESSKHLILKAFAKWPEIERASIFGSRAMGNFKHGSDVDLVIYGPRITEAIRSHLSADLNEELPLPYFFDVLHYESVENAELKTHIDTKGKELYRQDRNSSRP
ncbi:MAG: nucleotidyltransferase domain-containing protein [Limnochordia bacterium]|jgi:predicted nucleotidyltransferase|nr:nucleotidyltransferase domain-containing protein [Limnochordia bacterium]